LNFRKAAALLNLSQPPLSRHIMGLETMMRVQLFDRDTHRVVLTEAGRRFEVVAHRILVDLEAVSLGLRQVAKDVGPIWKIGFTSALNFEMIDPVSAFLKSESWSATVEIEHAYSKHLVERLLAGDIDAAVIGDANCLDDRLDYVEFACDPMVFALYADHPASELPEIVFDDLGDEPLFWFSREDNPVFYQKFEGIFARHSYCPRRRPSPADDDELLALISSGEGISVLPSSLCHRVYAGVRFVKPSARISPDFHVSIKIAKRKSERDPNVVAFFEQLASQAPLATPA
jgi:DNA-binding transcriptional LysR family regulator